MNKVLILYFSGTGNTKTIANWLKQELNKRGYDSSTMDIRSPLFSLIDYSEYDAIGYGFPIHAFNPPEVAYKTLKKLPKLDNKK